MKLSSGLLASLLLTGLLSAPVLAQDEAAPEAETEAAEGEGGIMSGVTGAIGGVFSGIGSLFETPAPWEGRPVYFSGMASYFGADDDRGADDGFGATLALGKRFTDGLALEVTGHSYSAGAKSGTTDNGDLKLFGFGVTALVFPFDSSPGIYGLVSVGPGSGQNHPGAIPDYKTTYFDTGLGWLYPINPKFLLRAEARYHMDANGREASGKQTPPTNNEDFYDGVFNIGVLMTLGQEAAPPAEEPAPAPAEGPLDSDNDGVPDDQDKCPGTPAGAVVNAEGCEADADGDGVVDREDKCPDSPAGSPVGPDGCPLDSDGDGVPDSIDECPKTPAGAKVLANGCALQGDCRTPRAGEQVDENGCAVDQTFILKGVNFEFDSDRLTEAAKEILNQVADTLQAYADVNVEIAGHTDSTGTDSYNLGLSERRSIAVKKYLVARGVEATRMSPTGYGEAQPIDTNDSEDGRTKNRRVELRVQEEENSTVAPAAAAPAAPAAPAEAAPTDAAPAAEAAPADGAEAAPAEEAAPQ